VLDRFSRVAALAEIAVLCHIGRMQNSRFATLDHDLGPEIDMLRTTVRDFSDDKIAPIAAEIDRDDRFPIELWPEMGALGLHGITVEEELGGSGLGYLAHCVAMEEVSRGSASVGLSYAATAATRSAAGTSRN
jgi:isovaleryl-CoA dehydrogenase